MESQKKLHSIVDEWTAMALDKTVEKIWGRSCHILIQNGKRWSNLTNIILPYVSEFNYTNGAIESGIPQL